jgi:shikimate dehydrogenase
VQFASVSKFPGKTGTYFYNALFRHHQINASYQAIEVLEISSLEKILLGDDYKGISVSMPYKRSVLPYLTHLTEEARKFESCNSILNVGGALVGHNTDIFGIYKSIENMDSSDSVVLLGNGSIATQYSQVLSERGVLFAQISRNRGNWDSRHSGKANILINATSIGTVNSDSPINSVANFNFVIDLSINQGKLYSDCQKNVVSYFSGMEFYKEVFRNQFEFYTGIQLDVDFYSKLEADLAH